MAVIVVAVLGIVSLRTLPVSLIPDINVPYITVQASDASLSVREMDEGVIKILRQQLIQINGLKDITSESKDGSGSVKLTFDQGSDMDFLFIEVNEKIDRCLGSLSGVERPKVFKSGATDIPAFYLNLTLKDGSDDFLALSSFASEVVAKRVEQLPEVAMADVSGEAVPEIMIVPDQEKLRGLGLDLAKFEGYLKSSDVRLGSLTIRDGEYRYNVKFRSFSAGKEDLENIYFKAGDRLLQIKDVASVSEQASEPEGEVLSDGRQAVTMAVIKQSDARMSDLKKAMGGLLDNFSEDYPDVDFRITRDQTALLEYSINNLTGNIIAGVLLACLIIFLFMKDFRSPALVALTIPLSLLFSMLVFHCIGLSINIISLSGLILGVGMMTDNTVVLIDNITARWLRGDSLRTAVAEGTSEVTGAMLSSVLTTCAVFIPLIFISGIAGAMFYDQAMSIATVLLTSYVVTITVIPVYYWWWYRKESSFRPNKFLSRFTFSKAEDFYERGVTALLRHRWLGWAVFLLSAVGIVLCFTFMRKEKLPVITYTDTVFNVDWNESVSLEQNELRVRELCDFVKSDVTQATALVGVQKFALRHSGDQSLSQASVYFKCFDPAALEHLKSALSGFASKEYPAAISSFNNSGNIFELVFAQQEAPVVIRLRPVSKPFLDVGLLRQVNEKLKVCFPDIAPIDTKSSVLYVADPALMALYGISFDNLIATLKNALNGNSLFEIVQGERTLPVVMGVNAGTLQALLETNCNDIPVSSLMRQTQVEDLKSLTAGPEGDYYPVALDVSSSKAGKAVKDASEVVRGDGNFEAGFSGSWFSNGKMIEEMIMVMLIALALLYLILAAQFESLVQPLVILSEIVIDVFFSLVLLWVCGVTINLMSMIGLVVICGIVINDSILKIDTVNRLRKQGFGLDHAILEAGKRRLKAIIMTSLTTILTVCPFLVRGNMGADLQYPMSLVIIAGMVVGTFVSLFFVPMLYYSIYRGK